MKLKRTLKRVGFLVLGGSVFAACERDGPTMPTRSGPPERPSASGMTRTDSAALASEVLNRSSEATTLAAVTTISLEPGDSILVTVQSTDCSGNPETVDVFGVLSGLVASGSCATLSGTTIKLGPATATGAISFRATHQEYGQGPAGQVSGSSPVFTVGMNDGFGDTDYNDVIITVQVIVTCPPAGESILDHPDFKSRYDSLMKLSKIDSAMNLRREWGMAIDIDPVAPSGIKINWPQVQGTPCTVSVPTTMLTIAVIHSHPYRAGEINTPCWGIVPYIPDWNGGGSRDDWETGPAPIYAATPEWVFRFDRNTPERDRWKNPNRYERKPNGCLTKSPIFPL